MKTVRLLPRSLFLLLLCLMARPVQAQTALRFSPAFRNYTTEDGLPNNWIYGIMQDREGYLWISSDKGVCRFDGYTFRQFPDTLYTNQTSVLTMNLMEDAEGRIWYLDFQNRLFYLDNDRIVPWEFNAVLQDSLRDRINDITHILVKGQGRELVVSASYSGIFRLSEGKTPVKIPAPDGIACQVLWEDGRHLTCPLINSISIEYPYSGDLPPLYFQENGSQWLSPPLPCPVTLRKTPMHLGRLRDGSWLLFWLGYVYCLKEGNLLWYEPYDGESIAWITEAPDGKLYIGKTKSGGLDVFNRLGDLREGNRSNHFLDGLSVSVIYFDREGGLWLGTQERGLFYCASIENGRPEMPAALAEGVVKFLDWNRSSQMYAGFANGRIYAIDRQNFSFEDISAPNTRELLDICFDPRAQILAVSRAVNHVAIRKDGKWDDLQVFFPGPGRFYPVASSYMTPGMDPAVWWGGDSRRLFKLDVSGRKMLTMTEGPGPQRRRYYCIREDQAGRVWACTREGLVRWENDRIVPANDNHPALCQRMTSIEILADTSLVCSPKGHGVVIWKPGGKPVEINVRDGLLSASIKKVRCMPEGSIWACSDRGVNEIVPDHRGQFVVKSYTRAKGLPSNNVNDVLELDGAVWLATDKGLYYMRTRIEPQGIPSPIISEIRVNNCSYAAAPSLDLPYDSTNVTLEFVSLYFRSLGNIHYAYRLRNAASADTVWLMTTDRRVNFPNLPPGQYHFDVKARSDGGAWSRQTSLALFVQPPWYATLWARLSGTALIGLLMLGLYRYRTNQIRTESRFKEEVLRLERSALQAQMNPHFIFNCLNSIQHFILNNNADAAVSYLAKFAKLVRSALHASVSGMIDLEEEIHMLDNYLALEQLRFRHAFTYQINTASELDLRRILLPPLIVQPFVENAVLHGMKDRTSDGKIEVSFFQEDAWLGIEVRDNGHGITQASSNNPSSLGQSITRRRLELLQRQKMQKLVSVEYRTPPDGKGTLVVIRLPLETSAGD